jgi:CBS domain-containing protein
MQERHVGAVVIVEEGRPIGIVTDRDLVLRVLAQELAPNEPVADVMSRELWTARIGDSIESTFNTMRHRGVRRLPIVDDEGVLRGLVAMDDLVVMVSGEVTSLAEAVMDNRGP